VRLSVGEGCVVGTQQHPLLALFTVVVLRCKTVKGGGIYREVSSGEAVVVLHLPFEFRPITDP